MRHSRKAIERIGPRPVLLTRYVAHQLSTRAARRRLRHRYDEIVSRPGEGASLRLLSVEIPTFEQLPRELEGAAATIRDHADDALEHRFDLLGSRPFELGPEIDWHTDFKSGYRWPAAFYLDLEVTRLDDESDAKVPWELSRCHHLVALSRASRLFEDERYAAEMEHQLDSWITANPTGVGINWVNAMEVGLRAVNWVWAVTTLPRDRPLEGTPYLRSNHFLSDILGLLALGWAIEGDPAAPGWFRFARRAFEREILAQVHDDGVSFEGSLPYHGLALEIFTLAARIARMAGSPLSRRYHERLVRMAEVSRAVRHPDGRIPQFGDNDSGRVLPAGPDRSPTQDHLLWLAASVVGRERPLEGSPDPEVAWTLGLDEWRRAEQLPARPPPRRTAFSSGGVYVLAGGGAHAVVRCGRVGQNGNGGHAHNDALSYELSYRIPLVVDSGTYAYTFDPEARNAFRSTAAHNTVEVDGAEINPIVVDELFRLREVANPTVSEWLEQSERVHLIAAHRGYQRLPSKTTHKRMFALERRSGRVEVRDELHGVGSCRARSYIHLAPSIGVTGVGSESFMLSDGDRSITVRFNGFDGVELTEGWVSDRYGARELAHVLVGHLARALPARFGYSFLPCASVAAEPVTGEGTKVVS
jgi:hypothetical protein